MIEERISLVNIEEIVINKKHKDQKIKLGVELHEALQKV